MYDSIYISFCYVDLNIPLCDTFPIQAGDAKVIRTVFPEPGGAGNTLIAGRRLGLDIAPVGMVGDDYYGRYLLDAYEKESIDTAYVKVLPGAETMKAVVLIDSLGKHAFVSMVDGNLGTVPDEAITGSRSLCLSGYMVATNTARDEMMRVLRRTKELGRLVFFDPGPLIHRIPGECMEEILRASDWTVLNETEAANISGKTEVEECAHLLHSHHTAGGVVVKAGERGCYILAGENPGRWYAGFSTKVVDTTGAGDAFLAGFMRGCLSGWDTETAALFANAVGAVTVSKQGGGTKVATFDEVADILTSNGFALPPSARQARSFDNLVLHRR